MKAKIADDLLGSIEKAIPCEGHRTDAAFMTLCDRIQGNVVDLVFTAGDAFEAVDNNYWLPECCWEIATEE